MNAEQIIAHIQLKIASLELQIKNIKAMPDDGSMMSSVMKESIDGMDLIRFALVQLIQEIK